MYIVDAMSVPVQLLNLDLICWHACPRPLRAKCSVIVGMKGINRDVIVCDAQVFGTVCVLRIQS